MPGQGRYAVVPVPDGRAGPFGAVSPLYELGDGKRLGGDRAILEEAVRLPVPCAASHANRATEAKRLRLSA